MKSFRNEICCTRRSRRSEKRTPSYSVLWVWTICSRCELFVNSTRCQQKEVCVTRQSMCIRIVRKFAQTQGMGAQNSLRSRKSKNSRLRLWASKLWRALTYSLTNSQLLRRRRDSQTGLLLSCKMFRALSESISQIFTDELCVCYFITRVRCASCTRRASQNYCVESTARSDFFVV